MDTVADALHSIHQAEAIASDEPRSVEHLEGEVALTLVPALLLFAGAAGGLGLVIYFFINLSDCQEDLINPYTLCERVNGKLHWELIARMAPRGREPGDGNSATAVLSACMTITTRAVWWQMLRRSAR